MRGGLDDALDKLARRDELRRRTTGETAGTPPAVTDLVEAIAAVVGRNPKLEVTVGVEGAGDPMLLHFAMEDGTVQVSADTTVAARVAEAEPTSPRHADFDIVDVEEPPAYTPPPPAPADRPAERYEARPEAGQETRRISYDDRDRYDPGTGYAPSAEYARSDTFFSDTPTADHSYPSPSYPSPSYQESSFDRGFTDSFAPTDGFASADGFAPTDSFAAAEGFATTDGFAAGEGKYGVEPERGYSERSFDGYDAQERAAQERATRERMYDQQRDGAEPHPFAPTPPPPVPPQTTRRMHVDQHRATEEPPQQQPEQSQAPRGMPEPLPEPIPLRIDAEATEAATRRLAALLRDNPTLLRQSPTD